MREVLSKGEEEGMCRDQGGNSGGQNGPEVTLREQLREDRGASALPSTMGISSAKCSAWHTVGFP